MITLPDGRRVKERKIPGGKYVKVSLEIKNGLISEITITGDFFISPEFFIEELESFVIGVTAEPNKIYEKLAEFRRIFKEPVEFTGISYDDISAMITECLEKTINLYYPGKKFPAISLTGSECELNCSHCGGHYLRSMISATDPDQFYKTCINLYNKGAGGVLISGGCDRLGRIALEPFFDAIQRVKSETGMKLNLHTGLIEPEDANKIAEIKIDALSFDLVGDSSVLKKVYRVAHSPDDYREVLDILLSKRIEVVPHICIGLSPGEIKGELHSIDMLKNYDLSKLIFIIFIPTKGTRMENSKPPSTESVSEVFRYAKNNLKNTELILGCMRPRRPERYEITALTAGATGIVLPSEMVIKSLNAGGWTLIRKEQCCAI